MIYIETYVHQHFRLVGGCSLSFGEHANQRGDQLGKALTILEKLAHVVLRMTGIMDDRVGINVEVIALVYLFVGRMYETIETFGKPTEQATSSFSAVSVCTLRKQQTQEHPYIQLKLGDW